MNPPAVLRIIDNETGEIREHVGGCASCLALQDQLDGATKEIRAWRTRYAMLKRDKEKEAEDSSLWPTAVNLFQQWRKEGHHPRSQWTSERFYLVEPFVRRHGTELCEQAIRGHVFDPYTCRRKNGTIKRFDSWDLLWRDEAHFEEACNKCPKPDRRTIRIVALGFVAKVCTENGRITYSELRYMIGWNATEFISFLKRRGWKWELETTTKGSLSTNKTRMA